MLNFDSKLMKWVKLLRLTFKATQEYSKHGWANKSSNHYDL